MVPLMVAKRIMYVPSGLHSCLLRNPDSHFTFMPELLCGLRRFTSLSGPHFTFRLRHQGGPLMSLGTHICSPGTLSCLLLGVPGLDGRCPRSTKEGCYTGIVVAWMLRKSGLSEGEMDPFVVVSDSTTVTGAPKLTQGGGGSRWKGTGKRP